MSRDNANDGEPKEEEVTDEDCRDALHNLARLSLVTLDNNDGRSGVRVHALVQRAATEHFDPEQFRAVARAAGDGLLEIWPDIERDARIGQALIIHGVCRSTRHPSLVIFTSVRDLRWG